MLKIERKLLNACLARVEVQDRYNLWGMKARRDMFPSLKVCKQEYQKLSKEIKKADKKIAKLSVAYAIKKEKNANL